MSNKEKVRMGKKEWEKKQGEEELIAKSS